MLWNLFLLQKGKKLSRKVQISSSFKRDESCINSNRLDARQGQNPSDPIYKIQVRAHVMVWIRKKCKFIQVCKLSPTTPFGYLQYNSCWFTIRIPSLSLHKGREKAIAEQFRTIYRWSPFVSSGSFSSCLVLVSLVNEIRATHDNFYIRY